MMSMRMRAVGFRLLAVVLIFSGFAQFAVAGPIDTSYLLDREIAAATASRIDVLLARDEVRAQLLALGVSEADVRQRVANLSHTELLALEGSIDRQLAGGDAIGVIGAVFLVLVILELVGITDIFKAF